MARLTEKQKRFVLEYLVDLNATQAAIRAGYSQKTAYSIGVENLKKPDIQAAIQTAMEERAQRTEITQDRVLEELAAIGFSKATDYTAIRGPLVETIPTDQLTEDQKRAIACIENGNFGIKVKLYDKVKALELLCKHLGMFEGKKQGGSEEEGGSGIVMLAPVMEAVHPPAGEDEFDSAGKRMHPGLPGDEEDGLPDG